MESPIDPILSDEAEPLLAPLPDDDKHIQLLQSEKYDPDGHTMKRYLWPGRFFELRILQKVARFCKCLQDLLGIQFFGNAVCFQIIWAYWRAYWCCISVPGDCSLLRTPREMQAIFGGEEWPISGVIWASGRADIWRLVGRSSRWCVLGVHPVRILCWISHLHG